MIKKIVAALAAAAMLIHVLPTGLAQADYEYVYVSVDGSDITGDGTVQNPVASLTGAKNIVAEYLLEGKNARVKIHAGVYPVEKIRFTQADSGTEEYPVIYEAYGDGEVVFSGAKSLEIGEFEKVSDPNVLLKLPQNARGKVLSYNLEETGIYCSAYSTYHNYLYVNGKEQVQARYPNYGYLTEDDITVSGATTLTFSDERISRWKAADDAILAGSVGGSYFWGWKKIKNISGNIMTLDNNISTSYVRMYVRNILEEIDMPGEYFVDRRNNMLYYYPVDNVEKMSITSYVGTDSLITMNGTSNVTLRGLTFEKTGGNQVIYAEDVKNVNITGCNFNYCQGNYVLYLKGSDCTVSDNTVYGCDGGFVSFEGGTLSTLEAGNIVFENNSITSCGRHYQYINAVFSGGDNSPTSKSVSIGNVIRNNIIGDCTTTYAITVPGNNNLIEGNEIYNQGKHIRDGGAVYFGRSNSKYGNSVVNNYFHDFAEDVYSAVYSDDGYGGLRVENNVIKNVYEGIKAGMGMNNIFNNNLLINCNRGLRLQTRMFSVDHDTFGNNGALYQETVRVLNNYETFSKTYGDLITGSIERKPFFAPWNSSVTGNVLIGDGKLIYSTPVHYYYQNGVNTDSILTISGEDEVEGIDDAVYENPNNNMMYVNEMELYGKKITDENGDNLNATEKGNRSYGYSDSYFENAESQDYTPSATLLDIENSLSGINISKTGIISSQNADAFEYDESVELVYPKNFQKIFRNQCEFKWSEVKNASKYLLIVSENEDLTNPVIHEEITENANSNVYHALLNSNTRYYWSVKAIGISRQNNFSVSSPIGTFTTSAEGEINTESFDYAKSLINRELEAVDSGYISYDEENLQLFTQMATYTIGQTQEITDSTEEIILRKLSEALQKKSLLAQGIVKCELEENDSKVVIEGGTAYANSPVSVVVVNPGNTLGNVANDFSMNTIRYADIINTDNNGRFSFNFEVQKNEFDMPGRYKVSVTDEKGEKFEAEFYYGSICFEEVSFKDENGADILNEHLADMAGKNITLSANIQNRLNKDITPIIMTACYQNSKLIDVSVIETFTVDKNSTQNKQWSIELSNSFNNSCELKIFMLEDMNSLRPMTTANVIY